MSAARHSTRSSLREGAAVLAALLLALYPPAIFFDSIIQKAGLGLFIVCLLLLAVARLQLRPTVWRAMACGVCVAALSLTRENGLIFLVAIPIWIALQFRDTPRSTTMRWIAGFALSAGLILSERYLIVARSHDPASAELHLQEATLRYSQGRVGDAESSLRELIRRNPRDHRPHLLMARILGEQGRIQPAKRHRRLAARLMPAGPLETGQGSGARGGSMWREHARPTAPVAADPN
jgi:hypothetical protein